MKLDINKSYNFLIVRPDHIGDVVLSLPVAESLKTRFKNSKVYYLAKDYTAPLFENSPFVDGVINLNTNGKFDKVSLVRRLKAAKIDVSISLVADKETTPALFKARIPIRIGSFMKLYSLLLTKRVRQKRSLCLKNEAEYNLDIIKTLGCDTNFFPKLYVSDEESKKAKAFIESNFKEKKPLVIIHPGSNGNSVEWGKENFLTLASKLRTNYNVLITGSSNEMKDILNTKEAKNLDEENFLKPVSLREFMALINEASLLMTNSTGPLHVAGALGVQTIGFYPDKLTMNCFRWGSFTKDDKGIYITPSGVYHGMKTYKEPDLAKDDLKRIDMDSIKVSEVLELVQKSLKTSRINHA
ncbi:glycosyltransferase family 9 protein [Helicobacter sp. 13S00401-1]|uniref:glycosyltransferase family 9 protein n=1 Tax=Helicobacter sp. 13S00401-1 TaxID=1905758 RepID=UPI00117A9949|nr:glycosyltransferase family 9 protein [Helicobacter sp. 13S00401-1]